MGIPISLSDPENLSPMLNTKSYRHLSAGLLVVGSILGCAFQAQAQTVNVPFNGNIPGTCVFGTPIAGTLAKHPIPGIIAASTGPGSLGGTNTGTLGSVTITCQGNSNVTIAVPVGSGPVGFAPPTVQAMLQRNNGLSNVDMATAKTGAPMDANGGPWGNITNSSIGVSTGLTTLSVHMAAGMPIGPGPIPTPIPLGNYNYTVNLSVTGN
jgi:hypothetical protein